MARDVFHMTVSTPVSVKATTGPDINVLQPLSGVSVAVYKRGTTQTVQIFQRPTGATEGPTPESACTGGPNPFTTGASGNVEFWCDGAQEIDVLIHDVTAPARITDRTIGWNPLGASPGSMPSSLLAQDGALALANMGADVLRQWTQIGQVIEWWRPNDSVPLPAGFEICDGHQVPAGSHEFAGMANQAINVPDLRNMMVLGADPTKAYNTGANQGDAPTDAPGIGGRGGSNRAKNFAHGHGVPGVDHIHTAANHLHSVGGLYTGNHAHSGGSLYTSGHNRVYSFAYGGSESVPFANSISGIGGGVTDTAGNIGVGGSTGACDRTLTTSGSDRSLNTATNSTTWTADPGTDVRPQFYGLLRLIKVRRA
jgi:hypothetical protein